MIHATLRVSVLLAALTIAAAFPATAQGDGVRTEPITISEIQTLAAAGLGDDVIVAKIQESGAVFRLDANDILALKREGLSDAVLAAMVRTGVHDKHYRVNVDRGRDDYDDYDRQTVIVPRTVYVHPPSRAWYRRHHYSPHRTYYGGYYDGCRTPRWGVHLGYSTSYGHHGYGHGGYGNHGWRKGSVKPKSVRASTFHAGPRR